MCMICFNSLFFFVSVSKVTTFRQQQNVKFTFVESFFMLTKLSNCFSFHSAQLLVIRSRPGFFVVRLHLCIHLSYFTRAEKVYILKIFTHANIKLHWWVAHSMLTNVIFMLNCFCFCVYTGIMLQNC